MSRKIFKILVDKRFFILLVLGLGTYVFTTIFEISLWYVLGFGVITGLIFGKVFCRWICPVGLLMEIIMGFNPDTKFRQMYQYHKLGCPIAWVSGWLNKYSLFKIKLNTDTCKNCGICDNECYMVSVHPAKFSLYKKNMTDPGSSYSCSKCLKCVTACPNGSLKFKV